MKGLKDDKIPVVKNAFAKRKDKKHSRIAEIETETAAQTSQHRMLDDGVNSTFHYKNDRSSQRHT